MFPLILLLFTIAICVLRGGRLARVTSPDVRWLLLALACVPAIDLVFTTGLFHRWPIAGSVAWIACFLGMVTVLWAGRHRLAVSAAALGALTNAVVLAANGGVTPTGRFAYEAAAYMPTWWLLPGAGSAAPDVWAAPGEATLWFLADVFPPLLPLTGTMGVGDLVAGAGVAWFVARAMMRDSDTDAVAGPAGHEPSEIAHAADLRPSMSLEYVCSLHGEPVVVLACPGPPEGMGAPPLMARPVVPASLSAAAHADAAGIAGAKALRHGPSLIVGGQPLDPCMPHALVGALEPRVGAHDVRPGTATRQVTDQWLPLPPLLAPDDIITVVDDLHGIVVTVEPGGAPACVTDGMDVILGAEPIEAGSANGVARHVDTADVVARLAGHEQRLHVRAERELPRAA